MTTLNPKHKGKRIVAITTQYAKKTPSRYQCPYLPKGQHCRHEPRLVKIKYA